MNGERFGLIGWLTAAAVAVVAFVIGFVWLPGLQASAKGLSLWDTICRAAGISRPAASPLTANASIQVPTAVRWNGDVHRALATGDAKRANELAAGCAGCHGPEGISASDAFPNLAGLPAEALYKQLEDYRTGKRQNPIMQAMVGPLDDQKIADLSVHFAALPSNERGGGDSPPSLVALGNPMRSIAPCAACHGPLGHKPGAPPLYGQKQAYLKAQLDAFADGSRHNDINQQMREIARALTPAERDALAEWYASRHRQ